MNSKVRKRTGARRRNQAMTLEIVYTVTRTAIGEDIGNLSISMPAELRGKWRRWPDRGTLLDLCHEMGRAYVYQRPLRKAQGTCEVVEVEQPGTLEFCGQPAVFRYPAMGGGHMRLCKLHGWVHQSYCERWTDAGWSSRRKATR